MKLYNSLTKKIESFKPITKNKVKMYVCGVTPYDTTHLGHAFTYLVFDTLFRLLQFNGLKVTYLQNITDLDTDLLARAKKEKKNWQDLGNFWIKQYLIDMKSLNVLPPTYHQKATSVIKEIIIIVKELLRKNLAYEINGHVLFDTTKIKDYGKISHYSKETMLYLDKTNAITPDKNMKNPLDFYLWIKGEKDQPTWDSPWGKGMPGWHIECPALIYKYLGSQIDIHSGGHDLQYSHHDNEVSQMEAFTGKKPFSQIWMHTGMVMYENEKMSKSLGNLILVKDLLKKYSYEAIRLGLLNHHYRLAWEYWDQEFDQWENFINKYKKVINKAKKITLKKNYSSLVTSQFLNALENDLNTSEALLIFKDLILKLNDKEDKKDFLSLCLMLNLLGILK